VDEKRVAKDILVRQEHSIYEISREYRSDMRVPARVFASESSLDDILADASLWQLVNVATLPGIVDAAYAMPDIHQGYGFPIGGVAGMDIAAGGIISPGGIGYDINCGVRLLVADVDVAGVKNSLWDLATALYDAIPSGVGRGGQIVLSGSEQEAVLAGGAPYMLEKGYGVADDIVFCEEQGCMNGADPALVSTTAKARGRDQLGTLGSGNHFLEVQKVDAIYDDAAAAAYGLRPNGVTVMIHCGSRGLGHQVCTDYVRLMIPKIAEWGIVLPDRELACAPFSSPEGQQYFAAMQAAANFAWANRHMIAHNVRQAWHSVVDKGQHLNLMYDVSHNMGKREKHTVNGKHYDLIVHRKGATRAFGPGNLEVPERYQAVGQPVLIPGTMGTASYVLSGTGTSLAFASSCHGAGRRMSRQRAKKEIHGKQLRKKLEDEGIIIRCDSNQGLAEEAPEAYKDVENVVDTVSAAGLARKVARLTPLAVIKGG
jgi:tRNA-splicing ligase RtcB (3'-phosphate/5'-hydroxy nucleic acid ligase)